MVANSFSFSVIGKPAPQGSKRSVGGGRFIEASKFLPAWRAAVVSAARSAFVGEPISVPVRVRVVFFLDKPNKPKFDFVPATPPDIDKLARGVLDALKIAGVYVDDALVVSLEVDKLWADGDQGAFVTVVTI